MRLLEMKRFLSFVLLLLSVNFASPMYKAMFASPMRKAIAGTALVSRQFASRVNGSGFSRVKKFATPKRLAAFTTVSALGLGADQYVRSSIKKGNLPKGVPLRLVGNYILNLDVKDIDRALVKILFFGCSEDYKEKFVEVLGEKLLGSDVKGIDSYLKVFEYCSQDYKEKFTDALGEKLLSLDVKDIDSDLVRRVFFSCSQDYKEKFIEALGEKLLGSDVKDINSDLVVGVFLGCSEDYKKKFIEALEEKLLGSGVKDINSALVKRVFLELLRGL
jgi:hypothetical protein